MSSKSPPQPGASGLNVDPAASSTQVNEEKAPGSGGSSDNNHKNSSSSPTTKKPSSSSLKRVKSPSVHKLKTSFWRGLVAVLLPCVSTKKTAQAHDVSSPETIVNGDGSHAIKEKAATATAAPEQPQENVSASEKPTSDDTAAGAATSGQSGSLTSQPQTAGSRSSPTRTTPAPLNVTSPSPTAEVDGNVATIIVPPSPTSQLLPKAETEGVTSGAVQAPGSTGTEAHLHPPTTPGSAGTTTITTDSDDGSFTDEVDGDAGDNEPGIEAEDEDDEEERLIAQGGTGIPIGPDGQPMPLLPPVLPGHKGRKCLVLDLDETLLHSSFKLIPQADYVVPVEIEWQWHNVYVIKRPGVDNFLKQMGEIYEIVVFTASLSKYADPVLDKLDIHKVVTHRLFRESCYNHKGNYVKDLSRLGRPIADTIILDNSPASYIFHPNNAVPVSSWFNDPHDTELTDLCPFLSDLAPVPDVRGILDGGL